MSHKILYKRIKYNHALIQRRHPISKHRLNKANGSGDDVDSGIGFSCRGGVTVIIERYTSTFTVVFARILLFAMSWQIHGQLHFALCFWTFAVPNEEEVKVTWGGVNKGKGKEQKRYGVDIGVVIWERQKGVWVKDREVIGRFFSARCKPSQVSILTASYTYVWLVNRLVVAQQMVLIVCVWFTLCAAFSNQLITVDWSLSESSGRVNAWSNM